MIKIRVGIGSGRGTNEEEEKFFVDGKAVACRGNDNE